MWPLTRMMRRQELVSLLGNLAFYNDKGIDICRHTSVEIARERAKGLLEIRSLVTDIGRSTFPEAFLAAVDSGEIADDGTGRWFEMIQRRSL